MQLEIPENIVIDGKEYPVSNFSENVKKLVMIHAQWRKELADERLAMAKTEAAIRNLDMELTQIVLKELESQAAQSAPAAPAA